MQLRYDGRIVIVSGAAHGIGRCIAEAFARAGARVHGVDVLAAELETLAGDSIAVKALDLVDRAATASWIAEVEREAGGAVDVVVNCAGGWAGHRPAPMDETGDATWDDVMDVNVTTTFSLSRAVVPGMKRSGRGSIVNITSGAGLHASVSNFVAYSAAKHAVSGITRQLAKEVGPFGITVNAVAPGTVATPDVAAPAGSVAGERSQEVLDRIFMRRLGRPEDIAAAVLFLASEHATWITGQVIEVDGGR